MGTSIRASPIEALGCFYSMCSFVNQTLDKVQEHIQKEHNNQNSVSVEITSFPDLVIPVNTPSPTLSIEVDDLANLASGEESASDMAGPSGLGPIRGRMLHHQARSTPYERDEESSSPSPLRRTSLASLSPLQINTSLAHMSPVIAPSPLHQLAYSHPNSPPSDQMNVDEPPLNDVFDEKELLAKASFIITSLPHLHTMPPTRLLVCTKCECGVLPSLLLSHSKEHQIKLLATDKKKLKTIMADSSFLVDPTDASPTPPCPPIEGIMVQNGVSCNLCSHCCTGIRSMQTHFSEKHKGVTGFAKGNSKVVKVQAFFPQRPKYFAVTPSLCGITNNENDLFSSYLRQCVPEIEGLKIINPPISENEVSPLLKVTQWHEHLKDYTTNRDSVRKLLELTKLPTSKEESWMGTPLRYTIEGYMKDVRTKANNATLGIRMLLKECPRYLFTIFMMLGFNAK